MKHARIDMGVAVPTSAPRDLGASSGSASGAGATSGTTRQLKPENDPRMRDWEDG